MKRLMTMFLLVVFLVPGVTGCGTKFANLGETHEGRQALAELSATQLMETANSVAKDQMASWRRGEISRDDARERVQAIRTAVFALDEALGLATTAMDLENGEGSLAGAAAQLAKTTETLIDIVEEYR